MCALLDLPKFNRIPLNLIAWMRTYKRQPPYEPKNFCCCCFVNRKPSEGLVCGILFYNIFSSLDRNLNMGHIAMSVPIFTFIISRLNTFSCAMWPWEIYYNYKTFKWLSPNRTPSSNPLYGTWEIKISS